MSPVPASAASTTAARRANAPWAVPTGAHNPGDWRIQAACRNAPSSLFFSPEGERGHDRARREADAKRICHDCPVIGPCREYALDVAEPYGTWGGLAENDRRRHTRALQHQILLPSHSRAADNDEHTSESAIPASPPCHGNPAPQRQPRAAGTP